MDLIWTKQKSLTDFILSNLYVFSYHIFGIRIKDRDNIIKNFKKYQIEFRSHYPYVLPNLDLYKSYNKNEKFIHSLLISKQLLSLPIYPGMKKKDINKVIEKVNKIVE